MRRRKSVELSDICFPSLSRVSCRVSVLEATKSMVAQHGKAAAFQEKTVGLQDAGATVGFFLIRRMSQFAANH